MKTKLFIDFDGTLFNTEGFRNLIFEVFTKAGFEMDEIVATYQAECLDYKYDIDGQLERLAKIKSFDIELARKRLEKVYARVPDEIFADVKKGLESIDRDRYEVNLLTLGDIAFQKKKVECSGLLKYFDAKYYCENQKWLYLDERVNESERFVVMDDRGDALEKIAKKFKKSLCLQVARGAVDILDSVAGSHFSGIKVKTLTQALKYLE